jgi:hypothetical protein
LPALKTLYFSLFHCHLIYAIEIWSNVPPSLLKPLISKQKATIRIISNKSYNAHTEPLFKALSILPLPKLITHFNTKFFHAFHYNTLPSAFTNTWVTTLEQRYIDGNPQHIHNLRNNDDYYITPSRTNFISRFPFFHLPLTWNELPANLKDIPNKNLFINTMKKFLLESLSEIPICNRLLCPACLAAGIDAAN